MTLEHTSYVLILEAIIDIVYVCHKQKGYLLIDDPLPDRVSVAGVSVKECVFPWQQSSLELYMKGPL